MIQEEAPCAPPTKRHDSIKKLDDLAFGQIPSLEKIILINGFEETRSHPEY